MQRVRWYYLLAMSGYVASLLGGLFGLVGPAVVDALPWPVWTGLGVVTASVGGVAGGHAATRVGERDRLESVGGRRLLGWLLVPPTLAAAAFLWTALSSPAPSTATLGPLLVACGGGYLFGGATVVAVELRYERLATAAAEPLATWSARQPARQRRQRRRASAVLTVLWVGSIVAVTATTGAVPFWLLPLGVSTMYGLYPDRRREFVALPAGLKRGISVTSWDRYEGYELTDDALVVHAGGLTGDVRCERAEIEDETRVVAALDELLGERRQSSPDS